jgi:hypothetical protein
MMTRGSKVNDPGRGTNTQAAGRIWLQERVRVSVDFRIGKRLTNLPALREVGFSATRRLLRLERLSHDPITGAEALAAVTGPCSPTAEPASPACAWARPAATPCSPRC